MNIIVNVIYLMLVLIYGKMFSKNFSENDITNNLVLVGIIFSSNILYRVLVNLYYKKPAIIKDILQEGLYRSLFIIVGIVGVNYLLANPELLTQYGINPTILNDTYVKNITSLLPYLTVKILLTPDV